VGHQEEAAKGARVMAIRGAKYKRLKNDDYPTPPEVLVPLMKIFPLQNRICDPCCGKKKNILKFFKKRGYVVMGSDVVLKSHYDFVVDPFPLSWTPCDIVTNPPYGNRRATLALKFIEKALEVTRLWKGRVAMLLPADFDSGRTRSSVFDHQAFCGKIVLLDRIKWFNDQPGSTNHQWLCWDWGNYGTRWNRLLAYSRIYYK